MDWIYNTYVIFFNQIIFIKLYRFMISILWIYYYRKKSKFRLEIMRKNMRRDGKKKVLTPANESVKLIKLLKAEDTTKTEASMILEN